MNTEWLLAVKENVQSLREVVSVYENHHKIVYMHEDEKVSFHMSMFGYLIAETFQNSLLNRAQQEIIYHLSLLFMMHNTDGYKVMVFATSLKELARKLEELE